MIRFQISTRHTGQYRRIRVFVYDTIDELKRATRRRDGFYGTVLEPEWYEQMAACTNCITIDQVGPNGDVAASALSITMRLSHDNLRKFPTEIVAHESAHAALYIYRSDFADDSAGEYHAVQRNLDDEEQLCYLVGDITRKVVNKLYAHKLF